MLLDTIYLYSNIALVTVVVVFGHLVTVVFGCRYFVVCLTLVIMRIKLNFADIQCYSGSSLPNSWFLLDPGEVKTVADLVKVLAHKFCVKFDIDSLQLMLEDCLLPHWESTHILRDNDTVRFVYDLLIDFKKENYIHRAHAR